MRDITIIHHETHLESPPPGYNPHADTSGCSIGCGVILVGTVAAIAFTLQPNLERWGEYMRDGVTSLMILASFWFLTSLFDKWKNQPAKVARQKRIAKVQQFIAEHVLYGSLKGKGRCKWNWKKREVVLRVYAKASLQSDAEFKHYAKRIAELSRESPDDYFTGKIRFDDAILKSLIVPREVEEAYEREFG